MEQLSKEIIEKIKEELNAVCIKYNVVLIPVTVHQGNNTFSSIEIAPQPAPPQADTPDTQTV